MSMKNPRVARRYAVAFMSVAEEQQAVDTAAEDLAQVGRVLGASRDLRMLLASPVVPESRKAAVMRELFAARIGALPMSFLDLLVRKHREVFLDEVIVQFQALRDELRNILTVDVTAAVELSQAQQDALRTQLGKRTGKTIRLRLTRNPGIMGGLVVKIGDTVLDASVTHQLVRLREQFAGSARQTTI